MNNNEIFKSAIENFLKRNNISPSIDEEYVKNFSHKFGSFIGRNSLLKDKNDIKEILIGLIKDHFVYYTKDFFKEFFKSKYKQIEDYINNECNSTFDIYISPISNKNTQIQNSSKDLLALFREENNLDRNLFTNFDSILFFQNDIENKENEINRKLESNPNNNYFINKHKRIIENNKREKKTKKDEMTSEYRNKKYLVLIDDFIGSGDTVCSFIKLIHEYLPANIKIFLVCVHVMEVGEKNIIQLSKEISRDILLYFNDSIPASRKKFFIDQNKKFRARMHAFEYEINRTYALGFSSSQALVANFDNCPNNTLCCFWNFDNPNWTPLFRRPYKFSNFSKNKIAEASEFVNKVKYALASKKVPKNEFPLFITLILIRSLKTNDSTRVSLELKNRFNYNEDMLQECCSKGYIVQKIHPYYSEYKLTEKGKIKLKQYKLSYMTFEKLISKTT